MTHLRTGLCPTLWVATHQFRISVLENKGIEEKCKSEEKQDEQRDGNVEKQWCGVL